jgi:YjbR protein
LPDAADEVNLYNRIHQGDDRQMTARDFRRIALRMKGAVESAHMGHPDFRANGKIFATLRGDNTAGMVKLTPDQQRELIRSHPEIFSPESGAWGRSGSTRIHLDVANEETVGNAMTLAWQNTSTKTKRPQRRK